MRVVGNGCCVFAWRPFSRAAWSAVVALLYNAACAGSLVAVLLALVARPEGWCWMLLLLVPRASLPAPGSAAPAGLSGVVIMECWGAGCRGIWSWKLSLLGSPALWCCDLNNQLRRLPLPFLLLVLFLPLPLDLAL